MNELDVLTAKTKRPSAAGQSISHGFPFPSGSFYRSPLQSTQDEASASCNYPAYRRQSKPPVGSAPISRAIHRTAEPSACRQYAERTPATRNGLLPPPRDSACPPATSPMATTVSGVASRMHWSPRPTQADHHQQQRGDRHANRRGETTAPAPTRHRSGATRVREKSATSSAVRAACPRRLG